jgi:hypothetical protein
MKALAIIVLLGAPAAADPCASSLADPMPTPVEDVGMDVQRGACLRSDLSSELLTHVLIDSPGFYGDLGAGLAISARKTITPHVELGARLRAADYTFVQTAVTKATELRDGPLVVRATVGTSDATTHVAVTAALELPYTRDSLDTMHTSAQLGALITHPLTERFVLHARLGTATAYAMSAGGSFSRLGFVAGSDAVWRWRTRTALLGGADLGAGWNGGFDGVTLRAGIQHAFAFDANRWLGAAGLALPVLGNERTNAILDLTLVRALE